MSSLPGLPRGLAITQIVLGGLGILFGLFGVLGLLASFGGVGQQQLPPGLPSSVGAAYQDYMDAAMNASLFGAFPMVISLAVSAFMILAGIQAVQGKGTALAGYAALAAVGSDLLQYVIFAIVNWVLISGPMAEFMEAASMGGPEGEIMAVSMQVAGMASLGFGILFGLGLCGFWIWAFTVFNKYAKDEVLD